METRFSELWLASFSTRIKAHGYVIGKAVKKES